jgi:hypothetical protein
LVEEWVAEECAEAAFAGEALEFGVVDDDGARVGFSGFGVDDGFGIGSGGDELG